jgi:hypothetical protein
MIRSISGLADSELSDTPIITLTPPDVAVSVKGNQVWRNATRV